MSAVLKQEWTPESRKSPLFASYTVAAVALAGFRPFGRGAVGQWTAHPIGLVIVIGLVLMGLLSRTPLSDLMLFSLLCGAIVGFFLWLHHR